ncbi:tetratricopeptide repeat protein [Spirosoma panaciterrae]|uniref:tetratricopeptide repeat protein n=1 Tax=Spirosoma panaciterrae TaxID=496058 RepID=UPI00035F2C59|nr:tetratricopeptide repeat protein [Spirosoma panaciterrae]
MMNLIRLIGYTKVVNRPAQLFIWVGILPILLDMLPACTDNTDEAAQFFLKGNVQLQKREYREAIRYYSEAIAKKADFADAYNNRGLARFRNDDREGALADYSRALDLDPDFATAYFNRAEVRLEIGDATGSLNDLEHIENQYRDSTFYHSRLGDVYTQLNRIGPAQAAYDRALQLAPANVEALTNRGALYFKQKAYGPAQQDICKALQLNPKQDAALNNQSLLLAHEGNYSEALSYIEQALALQPRQPYYLNNKAYVLLKLNRPAEALPFIDESLKRDDQNAWAHLTMGLYWLSQHQPAKAIAEFRRAESLDASVEALYYYMGSSEWALGHKTEACTAWQRGNAAGDEQAGQAFKTQCR